MSQFTPVMVFRLWEKFSDTCLEVSESMEVHGKRTFGYDVPIRYKRAASEGESRKVHWYLPEQSLWEKGEI